MRRRNLLCLLALAALCAPALASANTSHAGWPQITGMLLMNKADQPRPLDGRPGHDPFGGTDPTYSCDGLHHESSCVPGGRAFAAANLPCDQRRIGSVYDLPAFFVRSLCEQETTNVVPASIGHNELLGGHGSDTIHAGPRGDVIWGDYKPSGQPATQSDRLHGGPGRDVIYASHGTNRITSGGGPDVIHAHFGRGSIRCSATTTLFISRRSRPRYHLAGCRRISYRTLGY
jgi:hypothetical protein